MAIVKRFGVDWDGNGWFAWNALPTDPPNQISAPATINTLARVLSGTSGGASVTELVPETDFLYGTAVMNWVTGNTNTPTLQLGWNGITTSTDFFVIPGATARVTFWIRSQSATYDTQQLTIELIRRDTGVTVASSAVFVLFANGWTKVELQAPVLGGSVYYYLKLTGVQFSNAEYRLTGMMMTYGGASVARYNTGVESLYENVTAWVMDAVWNVGFKEAYQHMADDNRLTLTLSNTDRLWSPELSGISPIAGDIKPNRQVVIQSTTHSVELYRGWLHTVSPSAMPNQSRVTVLTATSARRFAQGFKAELALTESVAAHQVIQAALNALVLPGGISVSLVAQPGAYTWPYVFDNIEPESKDLLRILFMAAEAERGKLFVDRSGVFQFYNRAFITSAHTSTLRSTFTNTFADADYVFGDKLINNVKVMYYPRKISATADKVLWEADNVPITLAIGETKAIRVSFTDEGRDKRVSGKNITHTITFSGASTGVSVSLGPAATSCSITITNASGAVRTIASLQLKGTKITSFNKAEVQAADSTSISEFGNLQMPIDNPFISTEAEALAIAQYERDRHKVQRGRHRWIKYIPRTTDQDAIAVDRTVMQRIRVYNDLVDNTGPNYIIVGEEHRVIGSSAYHEVIWYLEPVYSF